MLQSLGALERNVQHSAVLAHVDLLAREHRVAFGLDATRACEGCEQSDRLVVDTVLRVVEEEPGRFDREPFGAAGICGE